MRHAYVLYDLLGLHITLESVPSTSQISNDETTKTHYLESMFKTLLSMNFRVRAGVAAQRRAWSLDYAAPETGEKEIY